MKKTLQNSLVFMITALSLIHCGSRGSRGELENTLTGQTFFVEGLEELSADIDAACNAEDEDAATLTAFSMVSNGSTDSTNYEVTFDTDTYSLTDDDETITITGEWAAVDGDTITFEYFGSTVIANVDVDEDDDTITISFDGLEDTDCGSSEEDS